MSPGNLLDISRLRRRNKLPPHATLQDCESRGLRSRWYAFWDQPLSYFMQSVAMLGACFAGFTVMAVTVQLLTA